MAERFCDLGWFIVGKQAGIGHFEAEEIRG